MALKPFSHIPKSVLAALGLAALLQCGWHLAHPLPPASSRPLPPAPSPAMLQLASLGEPLALSKAAMLYLQGFEDQDGISLRWTQLDYGHLRDWLGAALDLDPRGQYPLMAASEIYAAVPDPVRSRIMLDFVARRFAEDPSRRWPWLAHAAIVAKHRLHDLPLARQYAQAIRQQATAANVPAWARELEIFILEDMNELDSAKILIGGMISSGQISDPHELAFLERRLQEIAARQR